MLTTLVWNPSDVLTLAVNQKSLLKFQCLTNDGPKCLTWHQLGKQITKQFINNKIMQRSNMIRWLHQSYMILMPINVRREYTEATGEIFQGKRTWPNTSLTDHLSYHCKVAWFHSEKMVSTYSLGADLLTLLKGLRPRSSKASGVRHPNTFDLGLTFVFTLAVKPMEPRTSELDSVPPCISLMELCINTGLSDQKVMQEIELYRCYWEHNLAWRSFLLVMLHM